MTEASESSSRHLMPALSSQKYTRGTNNRKKNPQEFAATKANK